MIGPGKIALTRQFLEAATIGLADYAVGFVKIMDDRAPIDAQLAGSGTLVAIDDTHAILTADHVLRHLPSAGEVGLILPTRFTPQAHNFSLRMEFAEKVSVGRGSVEADGPDLALLVLPPSVVGTIRASKSFYNLPRLQEQALAPRWPTDVGIWCLCGVAHEWTSDAEPERGYKRVKIFRGMCGSGKVIGEQTRDGWDYINFGAKYGPGYEGPHSFEGCSGGGLWQIVIGKSETGEAVVTETVLLGVAFYQCAVEDGTRVIRCHGRRSIYGPAVAKIRGTAS